MFKVDILLINFIYRNCKALGNVFGYGATEGLVIYVGLVTATVISVINKKVKNAS
jgi:hypothetical protein